MKMTERRGRIENCEGGEEKMRREKAKFGLTFFWYTVVA
jgi:hypothetical protein